MRIQASVKGAVIKVDGASLDADGAGDSGIFVSAGHHVIEATALGYQCRGDVDARDKEGGVAETVISVLRAGA